MAINLVGEEVEERRAPVTLPKLNLPDIDAELEAKEAAERHKQERVIRLGLDAWRLIHKCESFETWEAIGRALLIGKQYALDVVDRNTPWWDMSYGHRFSSWCKRHGFTMRAATRSWCIAMVENQTAITAWRNSLPERERKRLVNPQSVLKRWKASTGQYPAMRVRDTRAATEYAWKRFLTCVQLLPPQDASRWRQKVRETMAEQQ